MPLKRQLGWAKRFCYSVKHPIKPRESSITLVQVNAAIGAVRNITSYVICFGKRCIMKRHDVFIAALGILLVWQLMAMIVDLPILPAPFKVFCVFITELQNDLLKHFVFSLWRVFAGM